MIHIIEFLNPINELLEIATKTSFLVNLKLILSHIKNMLLISASAITKRLKTFCDKFLRELSSHHCFFWISNNHFQYFHYCFTSIVYFCFIFIT